MPDAQNAADTRSDMLNSRSGVLTDVVFVSLCYLQTPLLSPTANQCKAVISRCCRVRQLRSTKSVIQNPIKEELASTFGHLRFRETATEMKQKGRSGI